MFDVYLDPNYQPAATYWQIEGLLLLFDKVFVYAPNANALLEAAAASSTIPISPDRFLQLAKQEFVIPVGASRYWDEE